MDFARRGSALVRAPCELPAGHPSRHRAAPSSEGASERFPSAERRGAQQRTSTKRQLFLLLPSSTVRSRRRGYRTPCSQPDDTEAVKTLPFVRG